VLSRYFRTPVAEIGYLRAILEGYDGVAVLYSPDARRGEIEWVIAEGQGAEAERIRTRLAEELDLQEIERPADWPTLGGPASPSG
jgi:hypothetical protein